MGDSSHALAGIDQRVPSLGNSGTLWSRQAYAGGWSLGIGGICQLGSTQSTFEFRVQCGMLTPRDSWKTGKNSVLKNRALQRGDLGVFESPVHTDKTARRMHAPCDSLSLKNETSGNLFLRYIERPIVAGVMDLIPAQICLKNMGSMLCEIVLHWSWNTFKVLCIPLKDWRQV